MSVIPTVEELERREAADNALDMLMTSAVPLALVPAAATANSRSESGPSIRADSHTVPADNGGMDALVRRLVASAAAARNAYLASANEPRTQPAEEQPVPSTFAPAPGDVFADPSDPANTPAPSNRHSTAPPEPSLPPNLAGASAGGAGGGASAPTGGGGGAGGGGPSAPANSTAQLTALGIQGAFGPAAITTHTAPTTAPQPTATALANPTVAAGSPAATSTPTASDPAPLATTQAVAGPQLRTSGHIKPLSPLPTVYFSAPSIQASETNPSVTLGVLLSASSSQTVTVQYATSDGIAKAGKDYTATSGTLTFPAGSTNQSINVPILDDNAVNEPSPESFNLTLSNPTNATLGSPSTALVGIREDAEGGPNLPPPSVLSHLCNCGCINLPGSVVRDAPNQIAPMPSQSSNGPVRYADGVVTIAETDLHSDGFGSDWGRRAPGATVPATPPAATTAPVGSIPTRRT